MPLKNVLKTNFLRLIVILCLSLCFSSSYIYADDDSIGYRSSCVESLRTKSAKALIRELFRELPESERTIEDLRKRIDKMRNEFPVELVEFMDDVANTCSIDEGEIVFPSEIVYHLLSKSGKIMNSTLSSEEKISDLNDLHQEMLEDWDLLKGLYTKKQTSHQTLANILVELLIWNQVEGLVEQVKAQVEAQVWSQFEDQIDAQVWSQVEDHIEAQVWSQVEDQIGTQVEDQVWDQVKDQVWDQAGALVWIQVWGRIEAQVWSQVDAQVDAQVWSQVDAQVEAQVWAVLSNTLQLVSAFDSGNMYEILKSVIHYKFLAYQLGSAVMRYSPEIKKIQEELAKFLEGIITAEQANVILNGLTIPESDDLLINTQLEMIRRNIQAKTIEQ